MPKSRESRPRGHASYRQRVFAALVGGSGLALVVLAGSLLLASLHARQADQFLQDWGTTGEPPTAEAFAVAEAAAIRAIQWHPGPSGAHWEQLGRVYAWRHWRAPYGPGPGWTDRPNAEALLGQPLGAEASHDPALTRLRALVAHAHATEHRPLWPYGRVRLARAHLHAGDPDGELATVLHQAFELGPWRPGVNRHITFIGLRAWPNLDPATRDLVLENARRTVRFSRADERRVRALGERVGLLPLLEVMVLP